MAPSSNHKETQLIKNPILKGFNPDPAIIRAEDDYYIATSTFEWFPGVQIHHSKDLVHWRLLTRALTRVSQLDLRGCSNSGGVWAPCLTYHNGTFYLLYSVVRHFDRSLYCFDSPNFMVTAKDIKGPWSEPIFLNSSGFDPSMFHDDDGRKWVTNMYWDHRKHHGSFGGILLQEYSEKQKRLVGPIRNIFKGTELGITEGPHLYKREGFYYLMTAEGGTSYEHAITLARSRRIEGPYHVSPNNPIITSSHDPELEIQKAGHGSLVETQNGQWYIAHLSGRPLSKRGRCVLGRETCIQKVGWTEEGWLKLEHDTNEPQVKVQAPGLKTHKWPKVSAKDHFDSDELSVHLMTLREPLGDNDFSLKDRPGFLRLKGGSFLIAKHKQSFVARRQQSFTYSATTCVEFEPETFQQMAGLVCFYDVDNFFYLRISHDEELGKNLAIITCDRGEVDEPLSKEVVIEGWKQIFLRVYVHLNMLQFACSQDGKNWKLIGPVFDASKLSDEYVHTFAFTGAFVGLACQDISGRKKSADFDFFEYVEDDKLCKKVFSQKTESMVHKA
jgi:xylan 1,4-beta-xylosidase